MWNGAVVLGGRSVHKDALWQSAGESNLQTEAVGSPIIKVDVCSRSVFLPLGTMGTGSSELVPPVLYTAPRDTAFADMISNRRSCYQSTEHVNIFSFPTWFLDTEERQSLVEGTWNFWFLADYF